MLNVLNEVILEHEYFFQYEDERIASNVYLTSLSCALRKLASLEENGKRRALEKNQWLVKETDKAQEIPVLAFDRIAGKLSNGKRSCDMFFYNFQQEAEELHYLAELKNIDKKELLSMLADLGQDGMFNKVSDSVQLIKKELEFGGSQEHEELVCHTHFFVVYAGKNNVPAQRPIEMPGRRNVSRDKQGKQNRAGRMVTNSEKREREIYDRFGEWILKLGLKACREDLFPGKALPRARKIGQGSSKVRLYSIFSAHDFAEILDHGFFDMWKWGKYEDYFVINTL